MTATAHSFAELKKIVGTTAPTEIAAVVPPPVPDVPAMKVQHRPPQQQKPRQQVRREETSTQATTYVGIALREFFDAENADLVVRILENREAGQATSVTAVIKVGGMPTSRVEFVLSVTHDNRIQMRAVHAEGLGVIFEKGLTLFRDEVTGERAPPAKRFDVTSLFHGFAEIARGLASMRFSAQTGA